MSTNDPQRIETIADRVARGVSHWPPHAPRHILRQFATDAIQKAAPLIEAAARADERAKVAEEIADAITALRRPGITAMLEGGWNHAVDDAAAIALQHAAKPAETAVGATAAHAESHRTSKPAETLSGHATQEGER